MGRSGGGLGVGFEGGGVGGGHVRVLVDEARGVVNFVVHDDVEVLSQRGGFISVLEFHIPLLIPRSPSSQGGGYRHTFFELCSATSLYVSSVDMVALEMMKRV